MIYLDLSLPVLALFYNYLFIIALLSFYTLLQRYASMPANKEIEEGRLTWLVYIIGAVIGGRVSFASTDEHDNLDGELVVRVLQLMSLGRYAICHESCLVDIIINHHT